MEYHQGALQTKTAATEPKQNVERKEIFVVYQNRFEVSGWVNRTLKVGMESYFPEFDFRFLHKELEVPGRHKTEYIVTKLRTTHKVVIVLSSRFNDCKYCRYALQTLIPEQSEKVVPITIENCQPPVILSNISYLTHDDHNFWRKLGLGLFETPAVPTCM